MKITYNQKLHAIASKYYLGGIKWIPALGDFYTLTRQSFGLEVFQISEEKDNKFGIKKVWDEAGNGELEQPLSWFDKDTFDEGFGENRVHLPEWLNKIQ